MILNELKSRNGQRSQTIDVVVEFRALNQVLITYSTSDPKLARDGSNQVHASKANRIRKKNASQENTQYMQHIHPMWIYSAVRTGRLTCCDRSPREASFKDQTTVSAFKP